MRNMFHQKSVQCDLLSNNQIMLTKLALLHMEIRGGARNFPTGGLTLPTRGLTHGLQGSVNAKNLRRNRFSPSYGG